MDTRGADATLRLVGVRVVVSETGVKAALPLKPEASRMAVLLIDNLMLILIFL